MTFGRITSKGQVTLPKDVREKLGLHPGDTLVYEVQGDTVRIQKMETVDRAWHRAVAMTLEEEWNSLEDDEAFSDLQIR